MTTWGWLCLALASLACATALPAVEVTTEVDREADFAAFATFAQAEPTADDPQVGGWVQREITRELEARGYRAAALGEADLVIVFRGRQVHATRRESVPDPDTFYYYRFERYVEGTLEIDVFDSRQKRRVWRGVGTVDMAGEIREEVAARAVTAILADFPERSPAPESGP